ncbi:arginine N-succinyltransferase [Vreelandella subglaciescola]|jgi:arginine N-succinyltransferase|uniref:Arginine succinyltransferase n=1 Tax=Vreelandella subglaciescola TaxID=29571 RepID=A0A1M7FU38_9GAMM|nr:arginine N-succinyltransferase [Halomonas subglaciescola]SHM07584.1 arginine succinyltransferase [Halomonas subglaciescola]
MLIIRPVELTDLPALEALASHATPQLTNLPAHRERLEERIARSQASFSDKVDYPGDEHYTFVLVDIIDAAGHGEVLGTATIRARAGAREAYYTYRQETLIHASQQLNVRREVQTLALSHEVSEATLLCAMSINPRYKGTSAESLLRRARLMFIAQYPERFSDVLAVAFPGYLDASDESPFWESVGRHFFARSYQDMNHIAGVRSKSFIAEVMPQFPLYLPLLTPSARAAIGREHPAHERALAEMLAEGFVRSRHVDIFDAGPVVKADRERLASVRGAAWHPVRIRPAHALPDAEPALVANQKRDGFRCVVARYALSPTGQLMLTTEHAEQLGVEKGRAVLAAPLTLPAAEDALDEGEM